MKQATAWVLIVVAGCAGEAPPPKSGDAVAAAPAEQRSGVSIESAVGALDPVAVREKADVVRRRAAGCVAEGREKLPYLAGDIAVTLRVDGSGRAIEAHVARSTLGHGEVEACILEAFREQSWPRPVGGKVGEISQSLGFEAGYDEAPQSWSGDELERAMAADARGGEAPPFRAFLTQLDTCKKEAGGASLIVTMYLDEDGFVQGVGMSAAEPRGMKASSCVATVVQTTSFPAPGKLVKATLQVP